MTADKQKLFHLLKFTAPVAAVFGLALAIGMPASAQQTTQQNKPQVPKLIDKAKHGDWTVRCTEKPAQQPTQQQTTTDDTGKSDQAPNKTPRVLPPQCVMVQIARHPEKKDFGISVLVVKQTVQDKVVSQLRITVPIGVYLPAGVGVEIDGAAIGRLGYELCSPQGVCVATTFLNDELQGKFKAGAAAKFYIKDIRGRDNVFDLSLKGYTKAYESL